MKLVISFIFAFLVLFAECAEKSFVKLVDNEVKKYVDV
ncbi:MAG: hypothetical protein SPLUMA1_SPLUMAMAG1_01843 [uncultured Sulfurimonas sp.]|nr:MAG: hypothetical protein SPLUMA1_SPLUMAMAG1_01843 [uncultured Sulfurimonas sp.]